MIINLTKQLVISTKYTIANTFISRFMGLIGRDSLSDGEALILQPCTSIHTYFMKFPIDCIFLDKNNYVIYIVYHLKPWKLSPILLNARTVIELPSHIHLKDQIDIGDKIVYKIESYT
ncbi:DUF192 domain-containing protein [Robertmurraya korlensis]|uniref:DUF192 domain-containing protein n=1 Tax=Robertmurraya korlensis TaxID=519977 RepID=UPI000823FD5E